MSAKENIGLMSIVTTRAAPKNVLEIVIAPDGFVQMKQILSDRGDVDGVLRTYHWDQCQLEQVRKLFDMFGSNQSQSVWMCRSVDGLFFELDNILSHFQFPGAE